MSEVQPEVTHVAEVPEVEEKVEVEPKAPGRKEENEEERAERLAKQQEADSRSIYVGNVDFKSTPEQLETFFSVAGVIERITILFDKYTGLPKGYAYVEFESVEAAQKAISELDGKEFRNRELRVTTKRTNLPRMSGRGRGRGGFRGGRGSFRSRGRGRGSFRGRGRGSSKAEETTETNGTAVAAATAAAAVPEAAPAAEPKD